MKSFEEAKEEIRQYINQNYKEYPFVVVYSYCTDDYELFMEKIPGQKIIGTSVVISISTLGNVDETRCYLRVRMSRRPFRIYVFRTNNDQLGVPYIINATRANVDAKFIEKPIESMEEFEEMPTYLYVDDDTLYYLQKREDEII